MRLFIVALFLCITTVVTAQTRSDSTHIFFYYGLGYHHQSFNGINNRLQNRPEYEKAGSNMFSFNLGYIVEHKKLLVDGNFVFGNSLTGDEEKRSSSVSLLDVGFNVGYNFSNNRKLRFYPFAGISYSMYQIKLNKDLSATPFDSVLQSGAVQQRTEPLKFTNGGFCYQAGFGVDLIKQKGRYMRSIGIRASYTGGFRNETWRINELQLLQNAPADKVNQFNVSLQFGVGRNKRTRM